MYHLVDRKDPNEHHHKLASIAEGPSGAGPYKATKVDDATVVIEMTDHSVENVSRSHVVLAPKQKANEEMKNILTPTSSKDKDDDYPTKENFNLRYIGNDNNGTKEKD